MFTNYAFIGIFKFSIAKNVDLFFFNHDKQVDECGGLAEFDSGSSVNYSFSNFSFKVTSAQSY